MSTPPHTTTAPPTTDAHTTIVATVADIPPRAVTTSRTHAGEHSGTAAAEAATRQPTVGTTTLQATYAGTAAPTSTTEHAYTQPDTMSDLTPNGTLAPPRTVEHQQPEVAASSAAAVAGPAESAKCHGNGGNGAFEMHLPANNSSTAAIQSPAPSTNLISSSSHTSSATIENFMRTTPSAHLAASATPAIVAPAAASTAPNQPTRSRPISADTQPISVDQASTRSSHHAEDSFSLHAAAAEDLQEEKSSNVNTPLSKSGANDFIAKFFANAAERKRTAAASPHTSGTHTRIDTTCHCLIIDDGRLGDANPNDQQKYKTALTLASVRPALKSHVLAWLTPHFSPPAGDALTAEEVCAIHIPRMEKERIHINFTSLNALHRALALCPFLVRCGSLSGGAWQGNNKPCGPQRHRCPELVQLTFTPTRPISSVDAEAKMKAAVEEFKIEYTALWQSASSRTALDRAVPSARIQFNLLPRDASQVEAIVKQRHLQTEISGGKIRIQAPNSPSLCRCAQCDQLGHHSNKCNMYHGFAMRLPMKQPVSYHGMTQIKSLVGARVAFLGSNIDEMKPSRRVTLLFDIDATNAEQLQRLMMQLLAVIEAESLDLFAAPYQLKSIHDRTSECVECGSLDRAHACVFQQSWLNASIAAARATSAAASGPKPADGHAASATSSESATADRAQPGSARTMCRSWFKLKSCPRRQKGEPCKFDHPDDHTVPDNVCYQFKQSGQCNRGDACRFTHPVTEPQAAARVASPSDTNAGQAAPPAPDMLAPARAPSQPSHPTTPTRTSSAPPAATAPLTPTQAKKRGRPGRGEAAAPAAAPFDDGDTEMVAHTQPPSRTTSFVATRAADGTSATGRKKQKPNATPVTNWADAEDEQGRDDPPSPPPPPQPTMARAPTSSLSGLSSPNKSTSSKKAVSRLNFGSQQPKGASQGDREE